MVSLLQFNILRTYSNLAKVILRLAGDKRRASTNTMASIMDPKEIYKNSVANMAYTHCKTRIVSLLNFDIPESATEMEYKELYQRISKTRTSSARALTDAVNSVTQGIAPPVAFPTETVYGLGADATNRASIAGIFGAKGRPSDNPLIVHVASKQHLERLTGEPIPAIYTDLVKEHWPGPLTILVPLPKEKSVFAENVHPGQRTIGFRVPELNYARFFIAATDRPIAAPSANSSGKPSPTTAQHVMDDMSGKINFILDGGNCDVGVESTVVDGLHDPPLILRPGGLSQDDLISHGKRYNNAWANVGIGYKQTHTDHAVGATNGNTPEEAPRAPGMKYKHYAPQGRMILFNGPNSASNLQAKLDELTGPTSNGITHDSDAESLNIAILPSTSWSTSLSQPSTTSTYKIHTLPLGDTPKQIARNLFAALRMCDGLKCRFILAEAPQRQGIRSELAGWKGEERLMHEFDAVLERMRKASSSVVE